ncbi:MAG: hypothetical protein Ta2G_01900 [Termitinemataceae bacterium]|nr:MAG: hypothetical protein Ta2G_01900 [Termitinemataceae bacterium]
MIINVKKSLALVIFAALSYCAFAQDASGGEAVKGRLLKATYAGRDTTALYEPIVTIRQSETMGVVYMSFELEGARARNSKRYEFYYDPVTAISPFVWKRRMRGVVVEPYTVYITRQAGQNDMDNLLISYEYLDSRGFGTVSYIVALEKTN